MTPVPETTVTTGPGEPAPTPGPHPSAAPDTLDLRGKVDRFGDLVAKSIDVAEVGLNLYLSILSSVGSVAQQKIAQKLSDTVQAGPGGAPPVPTAAAPPADQPEYGITNRLPLAPGGAVAISFSVNNEAATGSKQVLLQVEGFSGDRTGRALPQGCLAVSPAAAAILPMDFEKFVLTGSVPADTPPDIYRGAVAVVSETVIRIPVWLVVEPAREMA